MMKILGSLPVKSRLPVSAWLVAALVTLFSFASSLMHVGMLMYVGMMSNQAVSVSEQRIQAAQKSQDGSVPGLLARVADVLSWRG
jgi:hypothetical protein